MKAEANQSFAKGHFDHAASLYDDAIALLPPRPSTTKDEGDDDSDEKGKGKAKEEEVPPPVKEESEEEKEVRALRSTLYCNLAACQLKLEQFEVAVKSCNNGQYELGSWSELIC